MAKCFGFAPPGSVGASVACATEIATGDPHPAAGIIMSEANNKVLPKAGSYIIKGAALPKLLIVLC